MEGGLEVGEESSRELHPALETILHPRLSFWQERWILEALL